MVVGMAAAKVVDKIADTCLVVDSLDSLWKKAASGPVAQERNHHC